MPQSYRYGKTVILTGASSGIGLEIGKLFADEGYRVYGLSRRECAGFAGNNGGFLRHFCGDVNDDAAVDDFVRQVTAVEGGVGILINCAGFGIAGAIEETRMDELRGQFETNLFATLRMCAAVLPHMRRARCGLIINTTSMAALFPIPYQAAYSGTKAATEAMTAALDGEVRPLGVRAVTVAPGDTRTGFTSARRVAANADQNGAYHPRMVRSILRMEHDEQNGDRAHTIARAYLRLAAAKNPRPRTIPGSIKYRLMNAAARLLPYRWIRRLVDGMYA